MARRSKQLTFGDHRRAHGRGGPRKGAGRKPAGRSGIVHHVRRPLFRGLEVAHVTVRVQDDVPSMRSHKLIHDLKDSLARGRERGDFRIVHYSIQRDHVHMIVEADGSEALGRGMNAVSLRIARSVNRVFGRKGRVLLGRYHARFLKSLKQVRHAIAYVLLNSRKHFRQRTGYAPPVRLDVGSSGGAFDGWLDGCGGPSGAELVAKPKSWKLGKGWRRWSLIDPAEVPG